MIKEFDSGGILKLNLTVENSGYYKCISKNSIGKIEKIISVGYLGKFKNNDK